MEESIVLLKNILNFWNWCVMNCYPINPYPESKNTVPPSNIKCMIINVCPKNSVRKLDILSISSYGFTYKSCILWTLRDTLKLQFHWMRTWKVLERQLNLIKTTTVKIMLEVPFLWTGWCWNSDKHYHSFLQLWITD